jgi:hypothetical protein
LLPPPDDVVVVIVIVVVVVARDDLEYKTPVVRSMDDPSSLETVGASSDERGMISVSFIIQVIIHMIM